MASVEGASYVKQQQEEATRKKSAWLTGEGDDSHHCRGSDWASHSSVTSNVTVKDDGSPSTCPSQSHQQTTQIWSERHRFPSIIKRRRMPTTTKHDDNKKRTDNEQSGWILVVAPTDLTVSPDDLHYSLQCTFPYMAGTF
jgi:hypothetical protein